MAPAVVRRIENFPVGIANDLFFLILFVDARLFADASLQIVYLALGAIGLVGLAAPGVPARRAAGGHGKRAAARLACGAIGCVSATRACA